jgi:hypothetical protein
MDFLDGFVDACQFCAWSRDSGQTQTMGYTQEDENVLVIGLQFDCRVIAGF